MSGAPACAILCRLCEPRTCLRLLRPLGPDDAAMTVHADLPETSPPRAPWTPSGWRTLPIAQQPDWPDQAALDAVLAEIAPLPPLVFAGEARSLRADLANVAAGKRLLLQAGDCAESLAASTAAATRAKTKAIP